MKDFHKMGEDFKQAIEELNEEDMSVLEDISNIMNTIEDPEEPIKDKGLKKRIAKICFKLTDQTPEEEIPIMKTSSIIAEYFAKFNYGDELDNAMSIASELELPQEYLSGDIFKLWEKMSRILKKYLFKGN